MRPDLPRNLWCFVAGSDRLFKRDGSEGVAELRHDRQPRRRRLWTDRIKIDPSVVRGLEYYTGPVYEANCCSTSPTTTANRALRLGRRRRAL
jgi:histidyl-tRNA synthetase